MFVLPAVAPTVKTAAVLVAGPTKLATPPTEEAQFAVPVMFAVELSLYVAWAVQKTDSPWFVGMQVRVVGVKMLVSEHDTVIELIVVLVTFNCATPEMLPLLATTRPWPAGKLLVGVHVLPAGSAGERVDDTPVVKPPATLKSAVATRQLLVALQPTVFVMSAVRPSLYVPVATNCCCEPTGSVVKPVGAKLIDTRVALLTVSATVLDVTAPTVAVMLVLPAA
jgi:hypothetical protein